MQPSDLKITTITYAVTGNLGNYESTRLDITAAVADGQDADVVKDALVAYVHAEVKKIKAMKGVK